MAILLGIDTGGTYTDAVLLDQDANRVIASAKSLTTRPDLALGVGAAMDAVLSDAALDPAGVGMVALSTTLATNALVEGQGGRVALVFIGFDEGELARDGLPEALAGDPVICIAGGHDHLGAEIAPLDVGALGARLAALPPGLGGVAVAARFATRNPAHEIAVRDLVRSLTGLPVTCSHELSAALGGPRRALTAVLNARLIGMIDRLIAACEAHMQARGIGGRLMVVRGDGALISAAVAREKPIETILSGPAASIAGAGWLTGEGDALVSDIGGTTTDICLLRGGRPAIDPRGARVGRWRTMVEAVAMRTSGLGGDSEVHQREGIGGGVILGPRRLMPVALVARDHGTAVHRALDRQLAQDRLPEGAGRFVVPLVTGLPPGLDAREIAVAERVLAGPLPQPEAVRSRMEAGALMRLVARGHVIIAGVTPTDASHVLGLVDAWDREAAEKALVLMARRRGGNGEMLAPDAATLARIIVAQLTAQTADCLIEAALAEDPRFDGLDHAELARHPLITAALEGHRGAAMPGFALGVPVIGLGAPAHAYYGAVAERLGARMILPQHAGVANAIGAVVGQVSMAVEGQVTTGGAGVFVAHLPDGPVRFADRDSALAALRDALSLEATTRARAAGVGDLHLSETCSMNEVAVEGSPMFIEARLRITASGRPRIAA
ncbi:MAG: hydantoinase/oxoprolinase family protein [Rubellimicrobium sp.]|nr:hydantoinase/oxoprolinase family protein [Rubellimicrobium sp.]